MAISNVTQFSNALNNSVPASAALAVGAGMGAGVGINTVYNAVNKAAGAELYVNEYGAANAFRVVEGGLGADGVASTATEVLQFEPVVENGVVTGSKIVKFPAAETGAGNVKAGALAGEMPIGAVAGGVAIGAGIGLYEAATHEQFWNDLVSIGDGVNSPQQTMSVLWRMLSDGGIQSYCDKRDVDRLVTRLYQLDAFNVVDHIEQETTTAGSQPVTMGSITNGFAAQALSDAHIGANPAVLTLFDTGLARYPQTQAVYVTARKNRDTLLGSLSVNYYNIPSGTMTVYGTPPNGLYINATSAQKLGALDVNINTDGTIISYNWYDGSGQTDIPIGEGMSTTVDFYTSYVSNVGSIFVPKNPNVIYNGTDLLPPADQNDFWDTFSEWLANAFVQPGYNPLNNSIVPTTWIPITLPNINWLVDALTGVQPNIWTGIYEFPDAYPEPSPSPEPAPANDPWLWKSILSYFVPHIDIPTPTPSPYDDAPGKDPVKNPEPTGSTPAITAPTDGLSNALFTVYNPTQAQVNSLGSYLWTNSVIEILQQFFQNPLDAIISLHLIYCTPSTSGSKNIKLGYLDSGVSASIVNSQYKTIACGDVNIPEFYQNALDYDNVDIQIFLPFVGFRKLNTKEVMGSVLRVTYDVDVYTGICLAKIYVVRPNSSQLLYTFEGNCAIDIPLTSADRSRLVSGLITAGVSAVTGNPAGVVGGLGSVHASIERSGSFSGNAGAMGCKKPYVVIKRAISAQATNYAKQYGYPLNKSARLAEFKGYTRCQAVHVDIPYATKEEMDDIRRMLTTGIII